jgi:hypothetical protein
VPDDIGSGVTAANNVGRYEYVIAAGNLTTAGGALLIQGAGVGGGLLFSYRNENYVAGSHGQRSYQVIRVPCYATLTVPAGGLTALRWGGTNGTLRCGGILVFDVEGALNLNSQTLNVEGKGFRGGYAPRVQGEDTLPVSPEDYRNMSEVLGDPLGAHGVKGEGIAGTPRLLFDSSVGSPPILDLGAAAEGYPFGCKGRGAPGNAGGGGNSSDPDSGSGVNAGGGGGGNGGPGGRGARDLDHIGVNDPHRGGMGGSAFADALGTTLWSAGRVVMGGGGGSGGRKNANPDASHGNSGGGIVLIRTGSVSGTGTIDADGVTAIPSNNDASGGGGAGGSVVLITLAGDWLGLTVSANGGNGGNAGAGGSNESPGAGGGGGVILANASVNSLSSTTGGTNGTTAGGAFGAESGTTGTPDPGTGGNGFIDPNDIPGADSTAECAQNAAPELTVPPAQATEQDTPLTFSTALGRTIAVDDDDAGSDDLEVTLTMSGNAPPGTLTLATLVGLSFSVGDGTADDTMTFQGTVDEINAALDGLIFTPPPGFTSPPDLTLTVFVSDLGNNGIGGVKTAQETVTIVVGNVNDPPVNSVPGGQATPEDTDRIFSGGNGNLISISDPDAGAAPVEVTLTVTNGTLTLAGVAGLTFSANDGTADATMTFQGTIAAINTAMDGMFFTPDTNYYGPAQLTITTDDLGNTGEPGPMQDTDVVSILVDPSVNDNPAAADDAYVVRQGKTLNTSVSVLANDFDVDLSDTLTAAVLTGPGEAASFTLNADGTFTYRSKPSFFGTDSFTYTVSDGNGGTDTAVVTIRVFRVRNALGAGYCGLTGLEGFLALGLVGILRRLRRSVRR